MTIIYGIHALKEALQARPQDIQKVVLAGDRRRGALRDIEILARRHAVPVESTDRAGLDRLTGQGVHQGAAGFCEEYSYTELETLLDAMEGKPPPRILILLDGITDPQNLGSIIRTAHCLAAGGVVIPRRRAASVTAAVVKASSGASDYLPVVQVENLVRAMETMKHRGFWIYGADAHASMTPEAMTDMDNVAFVLGSEGKGLREGVRKHCDGWVAVPLRGRIDSLNVSVACGIILYAYAQLGRKAIP